MDFYINNLLDFIIIEQCFSVKKASEGLGINYDQFIEYALENDPEIITLLIFLHHYCRGMSYEEHLEGTLSRKEAKKIIAEAEAEIEFLTLSMSSIDEGTKS